MGTATDALAAVLSSWRTLLQDWASSGKLTAAAQEALLLDGEPQGLKDLVAQWSARDFSAIPEIVLLSNGDISGAMGAYAASTGKIYLNQDWLLIASADQVTAVLTEELGHHLDSLLNAVDTQGDEGEYFARILGGESLSDTEKSQVASQMDYIQIWAGATAFDAEASLVSASEVTTNRNAILQGSRVSLVSVDNGWGSAWWNKSVDLTKDWSTSFLFTASGGSGTSDGFTFTINGDQQGLSAIGDGGGNLGFFGLDTGNGVDNSYAVLFDMWNSSPASLLGFASSSTTIASATQQLPLSLTNNSYQVSISYAVANKVLSTTIGGQNFQQSIDLGSVIGESAYLGFTAANGGGTMDMYVDNWDIAASSPPETTPSVLRGNSLYTIVDGPSWTQAEVNSVLLGGHLVSINNEEEQDFVWSRFGLYAFIGYTDEEQEGAWKWSDGSTSTYTNWAGPPDNATGPGGITQDYAVMGWSLAAVPGQWDDQWHQQVIEGLPGIAEIPLTFSITRSATPKEGAGVFITSINLSAGTQTSGNLAEGATVYWKISGITDADLASGALTGSGTITNGKLDIEHSLVKDADTSEQFEVSVFSDAGLTQQIGTTSSTAIQESVSVQTGPILRGNSLYTIVDGPSWTEAEANSVVLGGHLVSVQDAEENLFIGSIILATGTESVTYWIGLTDSAVEGEWEWSSGESLTYTNWSPGEPNAFDEVAGPEDYAALYATSTPSWFDISNGNDYFRGRGFQSIGIAEIPLQLSITRSATPKEGAGVFTTSINLSAGTQTSGNLAEGATVYWKISGITDADLASGALTGSGTITNGKLDIEHSLVKDADTSEQFEVSVFSDAGLTQQIGTTSTTVVQEESPVLRGNSLYTIVDGPSWTQAEGSATSLGGHLVTIDSSEENEWLYQAYQQQHQALWIGITDELAEGTWISADGSLPQYFNWAPNEPNNSGESIDGTILEEDYGMMKLFDGGLWNDLFQGYQPLTPYETTAGIAEIPLTLSITRSATPKEGAGIFTTSINLSAGTQTSGNLAEGATVYWKISGIDANDLSSGSLTGSGTITNGKLDIEHSLIQDADTGEQFEVSVFSDAQLTQQIGTTSSVAIQESNAVHGPQALIWTESVNSASLYYRLSFQDLDWYQQKDLAATYGGTLLSIDTLPEQEFIANSIGVYYSEVVTGIHDPNVNGTYYQPDGTPLSSEMYSQFMPGYPNPWGLDQSSAYALMLSREHYNPWEAPYTPNQWYSNIKEAVFNSEDIDSASGEYKTAIYAEVPLESFITLPTALKEGAGVFTTSINLSAGSLTSGNLAEGITVYWKIDGITSDDLTSGALTGSGVITNGKLDVQHSLIQDSDTGETFDVSVYSDAGLTQQIGTTSSVAVQETSPIIRANSLYKVVDGPTWTQAEANSVALGGHLVTINNRSEYDWGAQNAWSSSAIISSEFSPASDYILFYTGFNDAVIEGSYEWASKEITEWADLTQLICAQNWFDQQSSFPVWDFGLVFINQGWDQEGVDTRYTYSDRGSFILMDNQAAFYRDTGATLLGIAEIPLTLAISQSGTPKEGAGVFTTSINLSAGTQTSGNLAEGATVYWKISGIDANDLASGSLTDSGTITNGKLDIEHSLIQDADTGEQFSVSVFSDAGLTQQIGTTSSAAVQEENSAPTDLTLTSSGIRENSAAGTVIGTLLATDPDPGTSFTYALVAGDGINNADNTLVEIVDNQVKVKSDAVIDFETNPILNLNIQVTDNGGLTFTKAVTASVLDQYEIGTASTDNSKILISGIAGIGNTSRIEVVTTTRINTNTGSGKPVWQNITSYAPLESFNSVDGITYSGGSSANTISAAGISGDPLRPSFNGQTILDGKLGTDTITGGSFRNWLVGGGIFSTPLSTATTAVDTLIGTVGATDVFDLRTSDFSTDAYSATNSGSARINNYSTSQDWIVLAGGQGAYTITPQTTKSGKGKNATSTTTYQILSGTELVATVSAASGSTFTGNATSDLQILYGQTGDPTETLFGGQQMFFG